MIEFRTLKADEIDVRIGNVINTKKWSGYSLLLYKDARCDMNILDETVGAENWQRDHKEVKGNLYCGVGIKNAITNGEQIIYDWIWKWDCGSESNTEKEKGESSDSFKRACVNWGIGRELYTTPKNLLIKCNLDEGGKLPADEKYRRFAVSKIGYSADRKINMLQIYDVKTKAVVYNFGNTLDEVEV